MNDPNCIFCKIIAGQIPSGRVYEDEVAYAFLDLHPMSYGHTLIVPKFHAATLWEIPTDGLQKIIPTVKYVASLLKEKLPCDGVTVVQNNGAAAGQTVAHVHFHLIPRWDGQPVTWEPGPQISPEMMQELVARFR